MSEAILGRTVEKILEEKFLDGIPKEILGRLLESAVVEISEENLEANCRSNGV